MIKRVGYNLYAHKSNLEELRSKLSNEMKGFLNAVLITVEHDLDIPYHIVKVDTKKKRVSVIECPTWNKYYEPIVGDSYCFNMETIAYSMKKGGNKVYHHRWMFVSENYKGFDIKKSQERTWELWDNPEFQENKNRVGNLDYWLDFLKRYKMCR